MAGPAGRRAYATDPSKRRMPARSKGKKSLGIMGTAGMISAKALKGVKWAGSPQASKLMMDVAGPGGYKKKAAKYIAKKVAPTAVKRTEQFAATSGAMLAGIGKQWGGKLKPPVMKKPPLTAEQKADKAWDKARATRLKEFKIYEKFKAERTAMLKRARAREKEKVEIFKRMAGE